MAQANIKAVITAEDKASPALAKFGHGLGGLGNAALGAAKALGAVALAAASAAVVIGVKASAQLETARAGFITLLGSAEKADATLARIKKEAARTPFEIVGLTQATQMLASVTKDGDKAIDIILNVGEGLAAMGRGQAELDRISVNLQQIAASGKAAMIDIKQFAFAGIPIFEMLQQETGLSGDALDEFIADGKVSFDLLTTMFDKANDSGGRFFNAFKNQAGTFDQVLSNMKDSFAITMSEVVNSTGLFDLLKQAMVAIGDWVTNNKDGIIAFFNTIGDGLRWAWENVFKPFFGWLQTQAPKAIEFLKLAWITFLPLLEELWRIISTQLWPALKELWEALKPYAPLFGMVLLIAIGSFIGALIVLAGALTAIVRVVTWVLNAYKAFEKGMRDSQQAVFNFMVNSGNWLKSWGNGFINIIQGVIGWILKIPEFLNSIAGKIKDFVGNIGIGGLKIKNLPGVPGFADGVTNFSGGTALVGERGPELVNLPRGSNVIPNNKISGGNTTININVGLMTGSAIERRDAAEKMFEDLKAIASMRGQTVGAMINGA